MIMKVLEANLITGACTVSASLSSLIDVSLDQPVPADAVTAGPARDVPADLLAALSAVTDPRCRRGVRHQLVSVLGIAICAVLTGARTYVAIAEWAADLPTEVAVRLGIWRVPPSETAIRRVLQAIDPAVMGCW